MDAAARAKLENLECLGCLAPAGAEIRRLIGQGVDFTDPRNLTPLGRPLSCCKVRTIAAVGLND
jgi:hypothetical protein